MKPINSRQYSVPNNDNREVFDLPGLNERERFKQFVERAGAAGQKYKCIGVFHQQRLSDEEIVECDATIEISIRLLFKRQLNMQPTERPRISFAPRLAASMIPGQPPVMSR
jgi:hypothetical protein